MRLAYPKRKVMMIGSGKNWSIAIILPAEFKKDIKVGDTVEIAEINEEKREFTIKY